jgi:hypothetical protein
MRSHPIGTGPFKFFEFKPNESIKLTRNPDYWKAGRPYLDGIEYTIIKEIATQSGVLCRQVRRDFAVWGHRADVEGLRQPGATGDLRGDGNKRQPHDDHQLGRAAF